MKRDFLEKLGITEKETIDAILDENSTDIGKAKGDVEAKDTQITELQQQLAERDKDIEELSKQAGNDAELQSKYQELQDKYRSETETINNRIAEIKRDSAVELELTKAGAKNIKAAKALLDLEKLEVTEDGAVRGLDEQITAITSTDAYLFGGETTGQFASGGNPNGGPSGEVDAFKVATENIL